MPATFYNGTATVGALLAPTKELGGGGGSKPRPTEGKMFPRGTGK